MAYWKCVTLLGLCILLMDLAVASRMTQRPNEPDESLLDLLITKLGGMERKLDRLETSENALKKTIAELIKERNADKQAKALLINEIDEMQAEFGTSVNAMKRRIAELETEREIDKHANDLLNNKIDILHVKLDRVETSENALKQAIAELLMGKEKHEDVLDSLINKIDQLKTSENNIKERNAELEENRLPKYKRVDEITSQADDKHIHVFPKDKSRNSDVDSKMHFQKKSQMRLSPRQNTEQVAFTAYLDHILRSIGKDQPIVYNRILLNDGHGYSVNTGIFRVPTPGVYLFSWSVTARKLPNEHIYDVWVKLVVNGNHQIGAVAESRADTDDNQSSNSAVIRCNQGDEVWISHYDGADLFGADTERTTSFMGILMYMTE